MHECFTALLEEIGRRAGDVRGIGVGVPGPVAFSRGEPVAPPIMPGWDGFSIPGWFAQHYDGPVLVDNDVNIMALGEHWTHWRHSEHLLYVKIGTGIGCGIVSGGRIHRGVAGRGGRRRPRAARPATTTSSAAAATPAAWRPSRAGARLPPS